MTTGPHAPMTPAQLGALVMRDAGPADLARLAQLHVDTYNETHVGPFGSGPTFAVREWQWREKLAELNATRFVVVIETPEKQLVGFCWVHGSDDPGKARLNKIYLRRSHQRQGLGRAMVRESVNRLVANGIHEMFLFTEPDNEPACSFYDKLGGTRRLAVSGKFDGMYEWADLGALQRRLNA